MKRISYLLCLKQLIVFVYQVYYDLYHYILFFRTAFGNHQRKSNKGVVGDALCAVRIVKNAVTCHKP